MVNAGMFSFSDGKKAYVTAVNDSIYLSLFPAGNPLVRHNGQLVLPELYVRHDGQFVLFLVELSETVA